MTCFVSMFYLSTFHILPAEVMLTQDSAEPVASYSSPRLLKEGKAFVYLPVVISFFAGRLSSAGSWSRATLQNLGRMTLQVLVIVNGSWDCVNQDLHLLI